MYLIVFISVIVFLGLGIGVTLVIIESTSEDRGYLNNKNTAKKLTWSQEFELKEMNRAFKCKCGITSRAYQFKGTEDNVCPHCEIELNIGYLTFSCRENEVTEDRDFPFAPKLTESQYLEIWNQKEEEKRIKEELRILESNDKEIEAWENIQLRKLEEFRHKAIEIEKELSDSKYNFNAEEFIK